MKLILIATLIAPALSFATAFSDKHDAKKRIEKNQAEFRACYNEALKTNPTLHGSLTLKWDINETGKVVKAETVNSTFDAPEMENCMIEHVKKIRFAPAPAAQIVHASHPFLYAPRKTSKK